jgi:hypothetical protein
MLCVTTLLSPCRDFAATFDAVWATVAANSKIYATRTLGYSSSKFPSNSLMGGDRKQKLGRIVVPDLSDPSEQNCYLQRGAGKGSYKCEHFFTKTLNYVV